MPLNYSKWDALEVSDDSDIEGHPNVDHRSLVNWKRRDIWEKRAARNFKIDSLKAEVETNNILLPRLRSITKEVEDAVDGPAQFSRIVEQLRTNPSPAGPEAGPDAGEGPRSKKLTYDEMVLSLLMKVFDDAREKGATNSTTSEEKEKLRNALVVNIKEHITKLGERQETIKKELVAEEKEKSKKITSENIHDGFDASHVSSKDEPPSLLKGKTTKQKVTGIEVLNTKSVDTAHAAQLASKASPSGSSSEPVPAADEDIETDELPEMTPSLEQFSKIPLRAFEESFAFLQAHREVFVPGAADALLISGFRAQGDGDASRAKRCVHQSLLLQYCEKLGKDGVRLFFMKMISGDQRAVKVFLDDVENTYTTMAERCKALKAEEEKMGEDREQIQLVAQDESTEIKFTVPDGPPPEHLTVEGEGAENIDIEEVRRYLTAQWEVFEAFPEDLKTALKTGELDEVNKVLGKMNVDEAENVVGLLDKTGILNVSGGGVIDATKDGISEAAEKSEEEID